VYTGTGQTNRTGRRITRTAVSNPMTTSGHRVLDPLGAGHRPMVRGCQTNVKRVRYLTYLDGVRSLASMQDRFDQPRRV
jgi:hypothetical protein